MAPRAVLSDEEESKDRADRDRLNALDARLDSLFRKRQELIAEMRRISGEQKALYDRRQEPQIEVERLYDEHAKLGKRLAELRGARDNARRTAEGALIALRELRLTFAPGERVRPDMVRKEIADLERRQQTTALSIEDENALIKRLRERAAELKEIEARAQVVASHEAQRKEAEGRVVQARQEVERLGVEFMKTKSDRDALMGTIRSKLEAAGGLIAELRTKGRARADVMDKVDAISREMRDLEREGRDLLAATRARQDEARKLMRSYAPRPRRTAEDVLASTAEAQLEELLKRGRVTLGG